MFYIVLGVAITMEIIADAFLKVSASGGLWPLIIGTVVYSSTVYPVSYLFTKADFTVVFIGWEAFGAVLALAVATFYFGEPFSVRKLLALCFAICALICSNF